MSKNNLKSIRKKSGLSQDRLSEKAGIPAGSIRNWEQGIRSLSNVYQLKKLADALDVQIEDLVEFN